MKKSSEVNMLKDVCEKAKVEGKIAEAHKRSLSTAFGARFTRAWEALEEGRVKKYVFKPSQRIVWIVVGKKRDYIIMPNAEFCSCNDFYFRVMDGEAHLCYHLMAQKIAEALSKYDLFEEDDSLFDTLMNEWKEVTP
jgi:predicted nucleic acid-binding Zn finger protein